MPVFLTLVGLLGATAQGAPLECPATAVRIEEKTESGDRGEWCEVMGIREGPYRLWVGDRLERSGNFKAGKMSGQWQRYHSSGSVSDEGTWEDNLPHGTWSFFSPSGAVIETRQFDRGSAVSAEVKNTLPSPPGNPWILDRARAEWVGIYQKSGGQLGTLFSSWVPSWRRGPLSEWVGGFGLGFLKSRSSERDWVFAVDLSAGIRLRPAFADAWFSEFRAGVQSWIGSSATAPSVHLRLGRGWMENRLAVTAGVQRVLFEVNHTTLVGAGLEYRFGN